MASTSTHVNATCKLLDDNVRNAIRSGIAITSVSQCIEELVLNSVDADARRISIQVDLSEFKLKVEDDGQGITKTDLEIIGSHYMTSKCHTMSDLLNLKHYGYRGEALASIINVSTGVEIISRAQSDQESYCRKFKDGVPSGTVRRVDRRKRPSHGVTVIVHGFLAKLPVRQNQIGPLEVENIKKILARIYIMNSRLQIDFKHEGIPILQTPSTNSVTDAFHFLYKKILIEAFSSYDIYYFQAWFSKELHAAKSFQYVYVNNRFTSRNKIHRALSELVAEVLGVEKNEEPRGRGAKYPIFVLNILTPLTEYDITLEPMKSLVEFKNWDQVLKGVEALGCRFKVMLQAESRKGLVMDSMMKKSELGQDPGPSTFGKSISTRTLTSAVHSRFASRVAPQPPPLDLTKSQRDSRKLDSEALGFSENTFKDDEVHRSQSLSAAQSKMAKFRSPDRPKLPRQTAADNPSSSSQERIVYKKISMRKSKRDANEPLFPRGYNCKRSRMLPSFSAGNPDCPNLMYRIQEKFPIFREDGGRIGMNENFEPKTPSVSPSQTNEENEHNPLDSPFKRLCLSKNGDEMESEGMWDIPDHDMPPTSPIQVSDVHFFGVVEDHFNRMVKKMKIPDLGKEAAVLMWQEIKKKPKSDEEEEAKPSSLATASDFEEDIFSSPNPGSWPEDDPGGIPRIPLVPAQKSVAEIVQMVLANQRHRHTSLNLFYEPNVDADGPATGLQGSQQYWQPSGPIPSLDTSRTKSAECRFVKEDLKRMRVIGQVDNKFIAATSLVNGRESLVLFDQHAVHERIRLENLLEEIRVKGNDTNAVAAQIKRVVITPPLQLELTDTEVRVVNLYYAQFDAMGIQIEVPRMRNGNWVYVHSAPLCFVERVTNESKQNRDEKIISLIQQSIQQQVRHIVETSGNVQLIPQETFQILCTQACHGAIKFGDPLDRETCKALIAQLALCNSPFQCAHGRPSLTPLFDLTSLPGTEAYRAEVPCLIREN